MSDFDSVREKHLKNLDLWYSRLRSYAATAVSGGKTGTFVALVAEAEELINRVARLNACEKEVLP